MKDEAVLTLKAGKERSVKLRHPWIFSGAIHSAPRDTQNGAEVTVLDHKGNFLARAYYNPQSTISARIFSFVPDEKLDQPLLHRRIAEAWGRRRPLAHAQNTMFRVVASEADLLPGLIIDKYGEWIVFQLLTAGMDVQREAIIGAITEVFQPKGLIERSDEAVRSKEGLPLRKELIKGEIPSSGLIGWEHGMQFKLDLWEGHKTGFYLDQRSNRQMVATYAKDKDVLNCFSYTGGFSIAAGRAGAKRVVSVDESRPALDLALENWIANGCEPSRHETVRADVFAYLRQLRDAGTRFDMIVMDPPKFVSDKRHIDRACRGYKDLNLLALQLLRPEGFLATFSCSGLLSRDLFQKVIFGATIDAGSEVQIIHHLSQADDHPVLLSFPESLYLKGLFLRKL